MKTKVWFSLGALLATGGAALADEVPVVNKEAQLVLGVPLVGLIVVVVVALLVAFFVTASMKAKLKTATRQSHAANYVRKDSLVLDIKSDRFLYKTEQRRKIEKS